MSLIDKRTYIITQNHYHGPSEEINIEGNGAKVAKNIVSQNIDTDDGKPNLIRSIISLALQIIGGLAVVYLAYKLGWK